MWDKIKKAINSNLSKPLDTFMTEQFNSWATQRNRIDAAISTRAAQTTVDAIKAKTDSLRSDLLKHPFCDFQQSNTTAANNNWTYTTFKTISGKGRINNIMFKRVSGGNVRAKILIDGNLAF